uniref:Uncharacterized protein n=1 Tax=Eutreptiella gymnastica TaxID=73025 RepID=A0A7S4CUR0_9EUGL
MGLVALWIKEVAPFIQKPREHCVINQHQKNHNHHIRPPLAEDWATSSSLRLKGVLTSPCQGGGGCQGKEPESSVQNGNAGPRGTHSPKLHGHGVGGWGCSGGPAVEDHEAIQHQSGLPLCSPALKASP